MSRDERDVEAEHLAARRAELAERHKQLRAQRAEVGEFSASVHEQAAAVHEELGGHALLDPQALREHADRDREMAAQERAALAEEPF